MGWASAGYIFDPVCEELIKAHMVPEVLTKVLTVLIKTLQNGDWDTEEESLGRFSDNPAVVKAFQNCDIYLWGTPEYDIRWGENSVSEKIRSEASYGCSNCGHARSDHGASTVDTANSCFKCGCWGYE